MKMVKSLLLGTAAGFVAFAGAQAADLPVKAKPVQYVKICDMYGAGYFYVPGTETCIKLGGYVRFNTYVNNTSGTVYTNGGFGRFNNAETKDVTSRVRVYLTGDVRSQTAYGTLRSYYAVQIQNPTGNANGTGTNSAATVQIIRGFIQFAGFTIGRTTSLADTPNAIEMASGNWNSVGGSTTSTGINALQYTFQFGNGFSASLGLEDSDQRDRPLYNVTVTPTSGILTGTDSSSSGANIGSTVPEITANLDVTQAWGSARVVGALHNVRGAYYSGTGTLNPSGACPAAAGGTAYPGVEACGRPSDKWGYFVGAGFTITAIPGMPGDLFGVSGGYSDGATAYAVPFNSVAMYKGGKYTVGNAPDGVYDNRGSIQTTKAWWVSGAYQHAWAPNLKSSVYGAYAAVDFSAKAQDLVCGIPNGRCNPDYNYWLVGSRIFNWTPVQNLDIGLDVVYWKFNSAKSTTGFGNPGGPIRPDRKIGNNDVWYANLQITRSFWP